MNGMVEFRVLGPLEIRVSGTARPPGSPKQRTVLGMLLAKSNHIATHDELIDELWGSNPPASGMANIRSYVARIRQLLPADQLGRLQARPAGYCLAVEPDELDLSVYTRLSTLGQAALNKGDVVAATLHLGQAQGLWRGEAFEGVAHGPRLGAFTSAAREQWLTSEESLLEARCRYGVDFSVVNALRSYIDSNPYRERAWRLLVQALDDLGARSSALAAYEEVRALLARDLGVDPAPELRELHRTILAGRRRILSSTPSNVVHTPRELPADVAVFIGRNDEVAQLDSALTPDGAPAHRPKIVAVVGPGGCGKSALAVHAAHRAAGKYPDGQLYVDLGTDDTASPVAALHRVLRSLLGSTAVLPDHLPEASALLRSVTSGRRLLMVLDDVQRAEQVLGLIPASGSCAVLLVGRGTLGRPHPDLRLQLGMLSSGEAVDLVRSTSGFPHDEVIASIAQSCGGLPLALRIAGKLLANRPRWVIGSLVDRLLDPAQRLDALEVEGHAVRDTLRRHHDRIACRTDDTARRAARLFAILSRSAPEPVDRLSAARMLGSSPDLADVALDCLVEECLLERVPPEHYRMHDLLRLYGAESGDPDSGSRAQFDSLDEQVG
ncbi:BTAD domain-containing putative transcriptional regulator [Umezawaea sp. NPDC059074]|uniref:AfsR/SARP family transcriptional regulator n=1 Tax=Umezawaea sp. NPDC059074 TaxID=3346716 RepID=UPI0036BA4BFF